VTPSGWLWLVMDVAMVAVLAIALTYGTMLWRLVGVITLADLGRSGVLSRDESFGRRIRADGPAAAIAKKKSSRADNPAPKDANLLHATLTPRTLELSIETARLYADFSSQDLDRSADGVDCSCLDLGW
jgi:hypothetical protein